MTGAYSKKLNCSRFGRGVIDSEVESDQVAEYDFCHERCSLCMKSCPSGALEGKQVNQKLWREHSEGLTKKGIQYESWGKTKS